MDPEIAHSLVLHLLITAISLYLFILFSWWWGKTKKATLIYSVTCFLMLGLFLSHFGTTIRYYIGNANDDFLLYLWWWPYRLYPLLLSVISYAYVVTRKIIKEHNKSQDKLLDE